MRSGGQRFLPSRQPGPQGLGAVSAPAVLPAALAVPQPVPLSKEGLERRDVFGGLGVVPAKAIDAYFTRLAPPTVQQINQTYFTGTPSVPGVFRQARLGGFRVPDNMIAVIFSMEYRAGVLSGGVEVPVPPGVLGRNLSFAAWDNGTQLGAFAGANVAPPGGFTYGEYAPSQQTAQVPETIQVVGTGPGMQPAPNQVYYVQSGHELVFTMTTLAATPIAIQSGYAIVTGMLYSLRDLWERIGSGIV